MLLIISQISVLYFQLIFHLEEYDDRLSYSSIFKIDFDNIKQKYFKE